MKIQPQPPEPKVLHDVTDPASVIREAEFPYGSADAADLTHAARHFLHGLADTQQRAEDGTRFTKPGA